MAWPLSPAQRSYACATQPILLHLPHRMIPEHSPHVLHTASHICTRNLLHVIPVASAIIAVLLHYNHHDLTVTSAAVCFCSFDFPLGDVVLQEALLVDRGDDAIPRSCCYVTMGNQVIGSCEKVCLGSAKLGVRSTQVCTHAFAIKTPHCVAVLLVVHA